mmetsp:Transcript_18466/g.46413  ORF Transcript_18466/g.46413 Transcript_18466/m.46413 type:complete len:393 (-) Transcript_18466:53-1231(-)
MPCMSLDDGLHGTAPPLGEPRQQERHEQRLDDIHRQKAHQDHRIRVRILAPLRELRRVQRLHRVRQHIHERHRHQNPPRKEMRQRQHVRRLPPRPPPRRRIRAAELRLAPVGGPREEVRHRRGDQRQRENPPEIPQLPASARAIAAAHSLALDAFQARRRQQLQREHRVVAFLSDNAAAADDRVLVTRFVSRDLCVDDFGKLAGLGVVVDRRRNGQHRGVLLLFVIPRANQSGHSNPSSTLVPVLCHMRCVLQREIHVLRIVLVRLRLDLHVLSMQCLLIPHGLRGDLHHRVPQPLLHLRHRRVLPQLQLQPRHKMRPLPTSMLIAPVARRALPALRGVAVAPRRAVRGGAAHRVAALRAEERCEEVGWRGGGGGGGGGGGCGGGEEKEERE